MAKKQYFKWAVSKSWKARAYIARAQITISLSKMFGILWKLERQRI